MDWLIIDSKALTRLYLRDFFAVSVITVLCQLILLLGCKKLKRLHLLSFILHLIRDRFLSKETAVFPINSAIYHILIFKFHVTVLYDYMMALQFICCISKLYANNSSIFQHFILLLLYLMMKLSRFKAMFHSVLSLCVGEFCFVMWP